MSRKIIITFLIAFNAIIWTQISPSFFNNQEKFVLPAISISLDSYETLPTHLKETGQDKTRLLYQDYATVFGHSYISRDQGLSSSCVGQSAACAIDILGAVEVVSGHRSLPPPPRSSASWIYGSSRQVGGIENRGQGSYARLAARSMEELGFLYEENFFLLGHDLTGDNYSRDNSYATGVPLELVPFAQHRISGYYKLYSYKDVRDAIFNGMPVIVGSTVGFGKTSDVLIKDSEGFLSQPWLKVRGRYWAHAMAFIGVSDQGRSGVLCQNSWGESWVRGPPRFSDEPKGSFWIDSVVVDKMVAQSDCFAIYGLK